MVLILNHYLSKWKLMLFLVDFLIFWLATLIALFVNPITSRAPINFLINHIISFSFMGAIYIICLYFADLYDYQQDYRTPSNITKIIFTVMLGTIFIIIIFYFPLGVFVGRVLLIIQASILCILLPIWRGLFSAVTLPQRLQKRLMIIGAGSSGRNLLKALRLRPRCGLVPVGFIDDDPKKIATLVDGLPVLGNSTDMPDLLKANRVRLIVIAITHEKSQELIVSLTKLYWEGCKIVDMPGLYGFLTGKIPIEHISELWLFLNNLHSNGFYHRHLKRIFDLVMTSLLLIFAAPIFIIIVLAIKLNSNGSVFYRQERLGKNGQPFQLIKFRSMVMNAESAGPQWARENDPRITLIGRYLRKLRLDELPQLINVLKGEMSLIGPRPERRVFIKQFKQVIPLRRVGYLNSYSEMVTISYCQEKVPYYSYRLMIKPGLTGWAQTMYPYSSSFEQTVEKLKYDLYYIKNMSFLLDMLILIKTVRIVISSRGI